MIEVHGHTRQSFILSGALAAAAALGPGAAGPFVANALGASTDLEILNFVLAFEQLETELFMGKAKAVGLSGDAAGYARSIGHEEARHVEALTEAINALGGTPAAAPNFIFPGSSEAAFLGLAYTLENVGVAAYNGAIPNVTSSAVLAVAGSIVQTEARHAATIALLTRKAVTPDGAFDRPMTASEVLAATAHLIVK